MQCQLTNIFYWNSKGRYPFTRRCGNRYEIQMNFQVSSIYCAPVWIPQMATFRRSFVRFMQALIDRRPISNAYASTHTHTRTHITFRACHCRCPEETKPSVLSFHRFIVNLSQIIDIVLGYDGKCAPAIDCSRTKTTLKAYLHFIEILFWCIFSYN